MFARLVAWSGPYLVPAVIALVAVACAASFAGGVHWQAPRIAAAKAEGARTLAELRADYEAKLSKGEAAARLALADEQAKAEEATATYENTIASIEANANARPPRIVRVRCNPAGPVPAAGPRPGVDSGKPPRPAADPEPVGGDVRGGIFELNVSRFERIRDAAEVVSARLVALQAACQSIPNP